MMSSKPLLLKDYLELDSNSDSIDGFEQFASMRHLLEVELRGGSGARQLIRTRSRNALLKFSSLIKLDFLLLSCSPSSINRRSRSRNLKKNQSGSFWKKRGNDVESKGAEVTVKDIVKLRSFNLPTSPLVSSSSSSWSESDCTGSDFLRSSNGSSESIPDIEPNYTVAVDKCSPVRTEVSHGGSETKDVTTNCNQEDEEKDQLSPVSIMDFRYDEEEEETEEESISDSSFHANIASIERAKQALLQKIRRFESLTELVPVDLDEQFSAIDEGPSGTPPSDDDFNEEEITVEMQAWDLLAVIKSSSSIKLEGCIEKLLLDFLIEGLNCNSQCYSYDVSRLMKAAREWIESRSFCWEQREHRGEMEIGQMDLNVRWRCFEEEKQEVAADLSSRVLASLLDELVGEWC